MSQSKKRGCIPLSKHPEVISADRGTGLRRNGGFQYFKNLPKPVTHLQQRGVIWNEV